MSADEITDRLYALPPEEFTQARNQAERELRKAGEREQADRVKALRKPTAVVGAVNLLVRGHRSKVEAFLEAAARLRDAQFGGKGDLDEAARVERAALDELLALGGQSVRTTLEAAAVDDEVAGELLAARLVREPEPAGFGTLLAHAGPTTTGPAAEAKSGTGRGVARPDDGAARAKLKEAKKVLGAAVAEERQAKQRWAQTQRELEKARATVEKAEHELDRLRDG